MHNALLAKGATAKPLLEQFVLWVHKDPKNAALVILVLAIVAALAYYVIMRRKMNTFGEIFGHEPNLKPKLRVNQQAMVTSRINEIRGDTDRAERAVKDAEKLLLQARNELSEAQGTEVRAEKSARTWGFKIPEVE